VAEKIFARQTNDGLWQWRSASVEGEWLSDVYHTGDDEALAESIRGSNTPVTLLLAGQQVVSCTAQIDAKEKRHMAKLLPYELEEQLIDNVDDMHLAFTPGDNNRIAVSYVKDIDIESSLEALLELSCDVRTIIPDYAALRLESAGITLVYDGSHLIVRTGALTGFAVEPFLAPLVLAAQDNELDFTASINLIAETEEQLDLLYSWLPTEWTAENGPEIIRTVGSFWDWLDPKPAYNTMNLRRGTYSRQLPVNRWLLSWKTPLIFAAAAYLFAVVVGFAQYQGAKAEQKAIVAEMNDVYLKAVPNGRAGDPEGRLEKLVKNMKGDSSQSTNLMALFNTVAQTLAEAGNISMSSFRYNSDQRELLMNIEGGSFAELEALRHKVEQKGTLAELLRVEAKGDKHSARMKVAEASE